MEVPSMHLCFRQHMAYKMYAIEEKNEIGWDNYMLGRCSKKWQAIQKQHLDSISSK